MSNSRTMPPGINRLFRRGNQDEEPVGKGDEKRTSVISVDSTASSDPGHTQAGVEQVEAVTTVWTTRSLIIAYVSYVHLFRC